MNAPELNGFPTVAAKKQRCGTDPPHSRGPFAGSRTPTLKPAKPAPIAGFRGPMAKIPAKIGISPIKTEEDCGKAAFSH
jgi:hypothetical protein